MSAELDAALARAARSAHRVADGLALPSASTVRRRSRQRVRRTRLAAGAAASGVLGLGLLVLRQDDPPSGHPMSATDTIAADGVTALAALAPAGVDLPGWMPFEAGQQDPATGFPSRTVGYYKVTSDGASVHAIVRLLFAGITEGSPYESAVGPSGQDVETVTVDGRSLELYDAATEDNVVFVRWRVSETNLATLSLIGMGQQTVTRDEAIDLVAAVAPLTADRWTELLGLSGGIPEELSTPETTTARR